MRFFIIKRYTDQSKITLFYS